MKKVKENIEGFMRAVLFVITMIGATIFIFYDHATDPDKKLLRQDLYAGNELTTFNIGDLSYVDKLTKECGPVHWKSPVALGLYEGYIKVKYFREGFKSLTVTYKNIWDSHKTYKFYYEPIIWSENGENSVVVNSDNTITEYYNLLELK